MKLSRIQEQQYIQLMELYDVLSRRILELEKERILKTTSDDDKRYHIEGELKILKADLEKIVNEINILDDKLQSNSTNINSELTPTVATNNPIKVFISYNHRDKIYVIALKALLKAENIPVMIDSEAMVVGQDIENFINQCIRDTDVTLSIISDNSLESAWVAMETSNTFVAQNLGKKKFIPCYIDSNFFSSEKNQARMQKVEQTIEELKAQIQERMKQDLGFEDLNLKLKRQHKLRENLPDILAKLQSTLCMDISPNEIERNFPKILQAIQS